ncbi:HAD family hydrolase [Phytohabitans houttuyneae]|uniref:HAD-IB family hydrolase n=1 Tax=Phytohabitans houttuyneae TaxID=1076126 RepID=A0A6V8K2L9_9ACTN|nr:HAD-IB family hydrolase [Phytohabitans houttuyneae]GFJ76419.1 hypothetical protein Phou_005990 [Phytohabitans houttuyneae]
MRPIAFFDVDGTLVAGTTMREFLRFRLGTAAAEQRWRELRGDGAGRAEANRRYFRLYAGTRWAELMSEGRRWYDTWSRRPDGYVSGGLGALRRHRAHGHAVVLVSGSFLPCLLPIAEHLGADAVLCTEPETDGGGVLTGTAQPMIGRAKAVAAQRLAADWHVPAGHCFAYGDHASDLDLLGAVGHPAVVGDDPDLLRLAARYGWPRLPAQPVAAPDPCYCGCAVAAWSMPTVEIHPPAGHGAPPRNARTKEAS